MMFEELMHMSGEPTDPVGILMAASLVRDEAPWLYELATEVYKTVKAGDRVGIERELARLERFVEVILHGPFMEEFGFPSKEAHIFFMEFPRMLQRFLARHLEEEKPHPRRRVTRPEPHQG
jgi:hypothetical protein